MKLVIRLVTKYRLIMRGGQVLPHSSGGWTVVWLLGTLVEEEVGEEEVEEETEKHS